jgi:hypothetical protein
MASRQEIFLLQGPILELLKGLLCPPRETSG